MLLSRTLPDDVKGRRAIKSSNDDVSGAGLVGSEDIVKDDA